MRKILLVILLIILLGGCKGNEDVVLDDFVFGNYDVSSYETNTYYLDVVLDEENDELVVTGGIIYVNDKTDFDELYLSLYANAIQPFMNEQNVSIQYLRINGEDVVYSIKGIDNTQIYIELDETLEKGTNFSIEFSYSFNYWSFGRIQSNDDYYLTMFFYPFVSMFDDEGWNIDPYTFLGESYYNDVGDYYVTLDVREDFLIASSGDLIFEEIDKGRKTQYLFLDKGRDFSFSASPNYYFYENEQNGISYDIYSIRELTQLEIDDSFSYMSNTFNLFETHVGEYYYDYFTLEYGYIYGMESSGVIYCSEEISEGTVVHEVIHQWFYSMIGNDQSDESFLDESLTTFTTGLYFREMYGEEGFTTYYNERSSLNTRFADRYVLSLGESLLQKVDEFGNDYGYLIYYHGVSIFKYYVDEYLDGDYDFFLEFLGHYYDAYEGKIASIDEFLDLLEEFTEVETTKEWFNLQINEFQDLNNIP